ncbi:phospholipase A2 inhibitor and Ly6/PLAUR domain-containing protein-like [Hemicordylus capensis]|uniref:phospholipase A2 inhibitor and Ly6/PLAUR domain-containing protein-like n=1 Tax=Hemicordylus capensis TaxID=884348 RepID=UPI00230433C3|nr:phospholipase A2 inhibitor and Ly6/PLAUR domain-containing protein-like [Hemicordylus capensis]
MKRVLILHLMYALLPCVHGSKTTGAYKGCISQSSCKPYALTLSTAKGRQFQSSMACCANDKCAAGLNFSEPLVGVSENGAHCPACESLKTSQCVSQTRIACTGIEQKCISLSGTSLANNSINFSIQGCATESACKLGNNSLMAFEGNVYQLSKAPQCTDRGSLSTSISPTTIFFPAIAGFLLVNVLP